MKHCGLPRSCALCAIRFLHVCTSGSSIPMKLNPYGEVTFQESKSFITASSRLNWPGDESMSVLDINYCLSSGRQDTGLYRILERLAGCFSFPYLHIFYHLLCKAGCKCKCKIHLCWDKTRAHRSLIQQRIHQHLQKTKQIHKPHISCVLFVVSTCFEFLSYCQRNYFKEYN